MINKARTPEHGTQARYLRGCHCNLCTRAHATYRQLAYDEHHPTPAGEGGELEVLETFLASRRAALGHSDDAEAATRADELDQIHAHITRIHQAHVRARKHS